MVEKILVAIDGSEQAWRAQDLASDIANLYGAELTILHVIPYEPLPEELREYARIEGIPMGEENARYHYSRTLGDKLTEDAEQRARKKGLVRVSCSVAEGNPVENSFGCSGCGHGLSRQQGHERCQRPADGQRLS